MLKNKKSFFNYLCKSMEVTLVAASPYLHLVGSFALLGFITLYWLWTEWFPHAYENLPLRIIASILGIGLLFTPWWPKFAKSFLSFYWFIALTYCLSFFSAYIFLMNHASLIAAMSLVCSVLLLVLLVDFYVLILILFLGWSCAFVGYYFLAPPSALGVEHLEMGFGLFFVIITGSVFNYRSRIIEKQRLAGMGSAAAMIAHELRTPLLSIKSGAQALDKNFPKIVAGYNKALEQQLFTPEIKNSRIQQLELVNHRIINEINYANTIIDMLLVSANPNTKTKHEKLIECSLEKCIRSAFMRYPFASEQQRRLVSFSGDFKFIGSPLLMEHIIFNLTKNALHAIATIQKGKIKIWVEHGDLVNTLYFEDTALGLNEKQFDNLFVSFYSTKSSGTGIGLPFCKMAMNKFGGDITCESVLKKYTRFILSFPKI